VMRRFNKISITISSHAYGERSRSATPNLTAITMPCAARGAPHFARARSCGAKGSQPGWDPGLDDSRERPYKVPVDN
jgi:hypothetical protein